MSEKVVSTVVRKKSFKPLANFDTMANSKLKNKTDINFIKLNGKTVGINYISETITLKAPITGKKFFNELTLVLSIRLRKE